MSNVFCRLTLGGSGHACKCSLSRSFYIHTYMYIYGESERGVYRYVLIHLYRYLLIQHPHVQMCTYTTPFMYIYMCELIQRSPSYTAHMPLQKCILSHTYIHPSHIHIQISTYPTPTRADMYVYNAFHIHLYVCTYSIPSLTYRSYANIEMQSLTYRYRSLYIFRYLHIQHRNPLQTYT